LNMARIHLKIENGVTACGDVVSTVVVLDQFI
jgi:hypothetical protein